MQPCITQLFGGSKGNLHKVGGGVHSLQTVFCPLGTSGSEESSSFAFRIPSRFEAPFRSAGKFADLRSMLKARRSRGLLRKDGQMKPRLEVAHRVHSVGTRSECLLVSSRPLPVDHRWVRYECLVSLPCRGRSLRFSLSWGKTSLDDTVCLFNRMRGNVGISSTDLLRRYNGWSS